MHLSGRPLAKPYRTRAFFLRIFLPACKKLVVLGHFSFQFELRFFLIWSWSIPVGASKIRCSTRAFAVSKAAVTDHSRHGNAKCEQDSKSGSRASGSWVRIPPYPPRSRQQSVFPAAGVSFCANETAGQYQPRADAPSQTTFAVYTARAMRLRAKNERGRCLPAALRKDGVRVLVGFWQRFLRGRSGRVERKHSKENERRLIYE